MSISTCRRRLAGAVIGILSGGAALSAGIGLFAQAEDFRDSPFLRIDPDRVVIENAEGYAPCGECHTAEWEVWQQTNHATGFETLHRSESAKDVLKQMGMRVTKRQEAVCMRCHYTVNPDRKAVAGVSCESCHGPARDWINVHNKVNAASTHAERERIISASIDAGMLRPSGDIYAVAANCYECHTVPSEGLVNTGGHTTGSTSFDLVDRVNAVRHNFLHAADGGSGNRELSAERRRIMFVVGRMLAYEYALRGLADASESGRYASAMGRRVKDAYRALDDVARVASIPAVTEILGIGGDLQLVPDNRAELASAAARIRVAGQSFAASPAGGNLAALDPLLAGERLTPPPPTADEGASDVVATAPAATTTGAGTAASPDADGPAAPGRAATARVPELPGRIQKRPPWFTAVRHSTVGPGECASCHGEADEWWYEDAHASAGRRLIGEDPRARRIAELYGIGAAGMARADQICASCHMTVDEPTKSVVEAGVSCESCHGPGAAYLETHQDGGNPQAGMAALKRAADRAQTCARCHHVSDERLLAAGHPSGADYDIAAASRAITHWPGRRPERGREQRGETYPAVADGALSTGFTSATGGRPIPNVEVVAPLPPPVASFATGGGPAGARAGAARRGSAVPPRVPGSAPVSGGGAVQLDGSASQPESTTPEELLLHVKQRLQRLYAAIRRGS